jgi:urease accessory protein
MRRAIQVVAGGGHAAADEVLLDFDGRFRRRHVLRTEQGEEVLLDLPAAVRLRDGDALQLDAGAPIRVRAKAERLTRICADDPLLLLRLTWHLGNRHLPVQILNDRLLVREDHVIADMARGLGARAETIEAPFDPEPGAYAGGHHHHHDDD